MASPPGSAHTSSAAVRDEGGNVIRIKSGGYLVIESGGVLDLQTGAVFNANGTQSAAIASLTDSTAGTANNTLEALPDPTDAPGTADALRDDLVAVLLPAIRNDFADLGAKVNAILAALRANGIIAT